MRRISIQRLETETIHSRALVVIAETAKSLCYALAMIIGVMSAQRYAAPDLPIPDNILWGIFIGTTIWASLTGLSIRKMKWNGGSSLNFHLPLGWLIISFLACTIIPILSIYQQIGEAITIFWIQFVRICIFSAFSFGLSGVMISLTTIFLHFFYWRFLVSLKWGIALICAIGVLLGLTVGWAVYGWMVFSSQALFSLNFHL
jgi:hypothetical protein